MGAAYTRSSLRMPAPRGPGPMQRRFGERTRALIAELLKLSEGRKRLAAGARDQNLLVRTPMPGRSGHDQQQNAQLGASD
eukprot:7190223-Pyramimonas_sp.AAC.1